MNDDNEGCPLCDETRMHEHNLTPILTGRCRCGHGRKDHATDLEGPSWCEHEGSCECQDYDPIE